MTITQEEAFNRGYCYALTEPYYLDEVVMLARALQSLDKAGGRPYLLVSEIGEKKTTAGVAIYLKGGE